MTAVRVFLAVVGVGVGGYGALLLSEQPPVILFRILVWAAVAVVVHDLVFAPLCAAMGFAGRRLIPARWQSPVAVAGLCSAVLIVLAIPVYNTPGMRPDNPTVLDRNYPLGLAVALAVVWLCVPIARLLPVRQDQVVERQRADDVEGQPPAV